MRKRRNSGFWENVDEDASGCWIWLGYKQKFGYGQVRINGKLHKTHRYAYEQTYGPIPDGLVVLHKCDNPSCCNPEHLRLGTHADNVADRVSKGRTKTGHLYGESNPDAKLTWEQVQSIRNEYIPYKVSTTYLAKKYGVTQGVIWNIVNGRKWKQKEVAPVYHKEIKYDRTTKDYQMLLDGECKGYARTYHEAEITLDGIVFELMAANFLPANSENETKQAVDTQAA